jgi:hypothetical protein
MDEIIFLAAIIAGSIAIFGKRLTRQQDVDNFDKSEDEL